MRTTRRVVLRRTLTTAFGGALAAMALDTLAAAPAAAAPATPLFGPGIDGYASYDPQDTCDPTAKPGVLGFRDLLNQTYGSHTSYITRACSDGGTSEHKEGRALDYMLDVNNSGHRAIANDVLAWLLATDQYGNRHAMARRLGMMYIIWNRQIWRAYRASEGWQPYSGSNPHTDHIHFSFSWAGARKQTTWWTGGVQGSANIYGALADGRLTFSSINAATGVRTHGAVVSTATLGFTPVALATLNFNTLLVTAPGGHLYRVDVSTNNTSLTFYAPVYLGSGWSHDNLAYDGNGHLFGIADGVLRRYTITATKPAASNITDYTTIDSGFGLKTLTTTGPDWILGTVSDGRLRSYRIRGAGDWSGYTLKSSTWQVFDQLVSPGGGVYFGHRPEGSMFRYFDANPYNGNGDDLIGLGAVDDSGWTQFLLSAQPRTVS